MIYKLLLFSITFLSICFKIEAALCPFYPHNNRSLHFELVDCPQCCEGKALTPDEACCYAFFRWYYVAVPLATILVIVAMIVTAVLLCQQSFKRNHRRDELDESAHNTAQLPKPPQMTLSNNKATNSASYTAAGERLVKKPTTLDNDDETVWERDRANESLNMRPRQTVSTTFV